MMMRRPPRSARWGGGGGGGGGGEGGRERRKTLRAETSIGAALIGKGTTKFVPMRSIRGGGGREGEKEDVACGDIERRGVDWKGYNEIRTYAKEWGGGGGGGEGVREVVA